MLLTLAPWDTEHFGMKVGRVLVEESVNNHMLLKIKSEAKRKGYQLLYVKGSFIENNLLDDHLLLVDEKIVYSQNTSLIHSACANVQSVLGTTLNEDLLQLAFESGKYSRFNCDKNFPQSAFQTLYRLWMTESLSGKIADEVLAYQVEGKTVGMMTYKKELDYYNIGLVAVSPKNAGQGIGTRLLQSFLSSISLGSKVKVATQKCNRVACHFYEQNGFTMESITPIYHLWVD